MLDVHPPHESVHGWRDFLLHLLTITIGLLIALSLEGCVEWQHHRHLVHEAEASLGAEIKNNAASLQEYAAGLHKEQASLNHDLEILKQIVKTSKTPQNEHMEIAFGLRGFDNVSWRTAQSTGAFSYMPYAAAQEYSDIYNTQDELNAAEHQAVRDTILSVAPFSSALADDGSPTPEQAAVIIDRIGVLQGQLMLVDSLVKSLDANYKKFLAAHARA